LTQILKTEKRGPGVSSGVRTSILIIPTSKKWQVYLVE